MASLLTLYLFLLLMLSLEVNDMKPTREEAKQRRGELMESVRNLVNRRIKPQTLGPCCYCEYPITHSWCSRHGNICDLCLKRTDTLMNRYFEYEEPLSAI